MADKKMNARPQGPKKEKEYRTPVHSPVVTIPPAQKKTGKQSKQPKK